MTWLAGAFLLMVTTVGVAGVRQAVERGDLDEAARQGLLGGPSVVEHALAAPDRAAQLGGIVAAPAIDAPEQMLPALAAVACGADRRVAIPAARAAARIAAQLATRGPADDTSAEELGEWRAQWLALALRGDRWIEVRTSALAVVAALGDLDVATILKDQDAALRRAALVLIPQPAPAALRQILVSALTDDPDPVVALGAAQVLCADLVTDDPAPVLAALGDAGLARIRALIAAQTLPYADRGMVRDAQRCLATKN